MDGSGAPVLEKNAQVTIDVKTGKTDWVITEVDDYGCVVIDRNGNKNE